MFEEAGKRKFQARNDWAQAFLRRGKGGEGGAVDEMKENEESLLMLDDA